MVGLFQFSSFSQISPINVYVKEIKVAGSNSQELYFGFAEGDQIVFNINEINNQLIDGIEITEYPSSPIFTDIKITKIDNKKININKKSIVKFIIKNNGDNGIACNIKIQRIPASDKTKSFNTNIKWVDKQDTTYKNVTQKANIIFDTSTTSNKTKVLVKTETQEKALIDKSVKLGRSGSANDSDKIVMLLQIPKNVTSKLQTKELKSWAYWIGAGKESEDAFAENAENFKKTKSTFTSPLSGYATGKTDELKTPKNGDIIEYYFMTNGKEAEAFTTNKEFGYIDKGKGVVGYGSNNAKGDFFIGLKNDSKVKEVDVYVKIVEVTKVDNYEFKETKNTVIKKDNDKPVTTKQMIIKTIKVPAFEN